MDLVKAFGISIRLAREELGFTQEQLGTAVNLHFTAIGRIERGERLCRIDTMEAIACGLEVELSELLRRAEGLRRLHSRK